MLKGPSERVQHWVWAGAMLAVALWRLRLGTSGNNLVFVGAALVFAGIATVRALQTPR
jgi:hypothetical protein